MLVGALTNPERLYSHMMSLVLALIRLLKAIFKVLREPIFKSLLTTLGIMLFSSTLFYHGTEGWSWLDAFYFSFISLMPTGMETGLIPTTVMGKWFTMIYLFVGIGVMLAMLALIGKAVLDFVPEEKSTLDKIRNKTK